jgi:hypothetical protein
MFTPTHLEWLDRTEHHSNGWPAFVPPDAQKWATERVSQILRDAPNALPLMEVNRQLFNAPRSETPECFHRCASWDVQLGCTYRALVAAKADDLWSEASGKW